MAKSNSNSSTRCAVVTGANKGIGLEICRQLASNGVMVVLTARDEKRGLQAVDHLKASGLSNIFYHQLNVMNANSIASLAKFIVTNYGKLDILVNNAGVGGVVVDWEAYKTLQVEDGELKAKKAHSLRQLTKQTYELAEECLKTNYYGTKGVTEALLPLLQLSDSARIVNVSASMGRLEFISNERAKKELDNIEVLTKERLEELMDEFLMDFKEGLLEAKGWPTHLSAYIVSKAAVNAYTRILAKEYPTFHINCVCPGFVKTDINSHTGVLTVEDGAKGPVMLALLPDNGPSGCFFDKMKASTF